MIEEYRPSWEGFERQSGSTRVKDAVCGREIDVDESAGQAEHDGWLYFFCSAKCHGRFVEAPDRYANERDGLGSAVR